MNSSRDTHHAAAASTRTFSASAQWSGCRAITAARFASGAICGCVGLISWRQLVRADMSDTTMCSQTLCPNAGHCYRVQAEPNQDWQSVMMFMYTISARGVECDGYMPTMRTVMTDSTVHKPDVNDQQRG